MAMPVDEEAKAQSCCYGLVSDWGAARLMPTLHYLRPSIRRWETENT